MPANRKNLLLAAGLFLLAGALHEAEILLPSALRSPCFLAVTLLYLGLSLGWAASIAQRIMHRAVRRRLIACAALAALWIVLRTCKYRFFDSEAVCLMLWYFYYLPQLFAPVLMLLAALLVNLHADADGLTLRLALEDAQPLDARWAATRRKALGATLAIERQDGTLYETLRAPHAPLTEGHTEGRTEGTGERA